ncbi:MAG: tetratricopeptide repeat protein [Alphaproteobacteria bacterium]
MNDSDRTQPPAPEAAAREAASARPRFRVRFPRFRVADDAAHGRRSVNTEPRATAPPLRRTRRVAAHSGNLFLDLLAWVIVGGALYLVVVLAAGLYFVAEDRILLDSGKVPKKLEDLGYDEATLRGIFMQYYVAAATPSAPSSLPALPIINNGYVRAPASRPWLIHRETSIELAGVKSQPMAFIAAGVQFFRLYEHFYRLDVTEDDGQYTLTLAHSADPSNVVWSGASRQIRELVGDAAAALAARGATAFAAPTPDELRKLECTLQADVARRREATLIRLGYVQIQLGKWDEALRSFHLALTAQAAAAEAARAALPRMTAPASATGREGPPDPPAAHCLGDPAKPEPPARNDTSGARLSEGVLPEAAGPRPAALPTLSAEQTRQMAQPDRVLLGFGLIALQRQRWDEAAAYFDLAARANPLNESAHVGLAETALRRADDLRAIEHFQRAARLNPNNDATYANLGAAHLQAGKIDEAITALTRAIKLNPHNVAALLNLGRTALMRRQFAEAARFYERAEAVAPQDPAAVAGLGETYLSLGRNDTAQVKFERALELLAKSQPGATADSTTLRLTWRTTSLLAMSLASLNRAEADRRAAEIFANLAEEWRADNDVGRTYAFVLLRQGNLAAARDEFQKVLGNDATDVRAAVGLAETFDKLGQPEMAQTSFERAWRTDPKAPETLMRWGKWLVQAGQYAPAADKFAAAAALDGEDPAPLTAWAEALALQKKFDEAEVKCRQALAIAMSDPAANVCLTAVRDARAKQE